MDRKLGIVGSCVNLAGVVVFALNMLIGTPKVSYLSSIFIAWGLVVMNAGFWRFGRSDAKVAAGCAAVFGGMYALCNTLIYFTQMTAVALGGLSAQAADILDYSRFGLSFELDLLGYCLMAVSTFFAGLTIAVKDRGDRGLKILLMIHGLFAPTCFVIPMLGMFHPGMAGASWI